MNLSSALISGFFSVVLGLNAFGQSNELRPVFAFERTIKIDLEDCKAAWKTKEESPADGYALRIGSCEVRGPKEPSAPTSKEIDIDTYVSEFGAKTEHQKTNIGIVIGAFGYLVVVERPTFNEQARAQVKFEDVSSFVESILQKRFGKNWNYETKHWVYSAQAQRPGDRKAGRAVLRSRRVAIDLELCKKNWLITTTTESKGSLSSAKCVVKDGYAGSDVGSYIPHLEQGGGWAAPYGLFIKSFFDGFEISANIRKEDPKAYEFETVRPSLEALTASDGVKKFSPSFRFYSPLWAPLKLLPFSAGERDQNIGLVNEASIKIAVSLDHCKANWKQEKAYRGDLGSCTVKVPAPPLQPIGYLDYLSFIWGNLNDLTKQKPFASFHGSLQEYKLEFVTPTGEPTDFETAKPTLIQLLESQLTNHQYSVRYLTVAAAK